MLTELPDDAHRWTAAERELASQLLTVVVNVRRGGPHRHLVPWLLAQGRITYVGHAGSRHSWPQSVFANPFVKQAGADREAVVRRYREWLDEQPELLARISDGELIGRALGCWCAPQLCHADVLAERAGS
ncbi:MAG: DUF4326 domain-containing protein [Pseudonocardiales bacterium]